MYVTESGSLLYGIRDRTALANGSGQSQGWGVGLTYGMSSLLNNGTTFGGVCTLASRKKFREVQLREMNRPRHSYDI